jgi:hypothetical protein
MYTHACTRNSFADFALEGAPFFAEEQEELCDDVTVLAQGSLIRAFSGGGACSDHAGWTAMVDPAGCTASALGLLAISDLTQCVTCVRALACACAFVSEQVNERVSE